MTKEQARAKWQRWRSKTGNAEKHRERNRLWRIKNRETFQAQFRRGNKSKQDRLSDAYVANQIGLPVAVIPPAMIEAKRIQIQLWRMTR